MVFNKQELEALYLHMSIDEMARHLDIARSTLYYHMKKLGIKLRDKSQAQQHHLERSPHQRSGKKHTDKTKAKISDGARKFWDSDAGQEQKVKLGDLRRKEWKKRSSKERSHVLHKLQTAERPSPGELSRFGTVLADFLAKREEVKTGISLTSGHVSDIILPTRKVVVEMVLPVSVYGDKQQQRLDDRYDRLIGQLNDAGYRVVIVEDKSNSTSLARCQRVYDQLLSFFQNTTLRRMTIVS